MVDRIKKVMEYEGMTPAHFADYIEIGRAVMSHILNGRNKPSLEVVTKILNKIDYIDSNWLLTGQGSMLREEGGAIVKKAEATENKEQYLTRDLFGSSDEVAESEVLRTTIPGTNVYRKETEVNKAINSSQQAVIQPIEVVEKEEKKIAKIIIYYSNNTFETFCPEKTESHKK